jgi:hypothetical protein
LAVSGRQDRNTTYSHASTWHHDHLVLLIRNDLAQKYIAYLLWIDQTSGYIHPETKKQMLKSAEKQKYREAVGIYLLAQIVENGRR